MQTVRTNPDTNPETEENTERSDSPSDIETTGAISDAGDPRTMETDPNGAKTAVGVRQSGVDDILPIPEEMEIETGELSDYDHFTPPHEEFPAESDEGQSFPDESQDILRSPEEQAEIEQVMLRHLRDGLGSDGTATVDNQTNQPGRFQNSRAR